MPELTLNISPPPPPTLVLDISPPQGPEGPQGNTGPEGPQGEIGPEGPQPDLSADTPEDLGTAAAGVSTEASRSDHVHAMPSAADVGADPAGAASIVAGDLSTHESLTTTAHGGIVGDTDARLTDARTPLAHTHGQSDVTGLVADMAAKQPLDSDLTAIAALSTTAFGRSLLEVVDAVGGRAALSAAAATHVHSGADITSGIVAPARLHRVNPTQYPGSSQPFAATAVGNATSNGGMNVAYRIAYLPIELGERVYNLLSVTTATAGAGTTWGFGMYNLTANGEPGSLITTFGSIDMGAAAGIQDLPISFTPTRTGWHYIAVKVAALGTPPQVRSSAEFGAPPPAIPGWPLRRNGATFAGLMQTSGLSAGPLPAVASAVGVGTGELAYGSTLPIAYLGMA